MSASEQQIIKDVQTVCKQAVEQGKHLDLTIRGVIQQLVDEMKHDEEFLTSKPIKKIIKTIATECLQPRIEPESNPADQKLDDSKEVVEQPEEAVLKKDSPSLPNQSSASPSRPPSKKRTSGKSLYKSAEMIDSDGNSLHEDESSSNAKPTSSKSKPPKERKPRKPKQSKVEAKQELKAEVDDNGDPKLEDEEKPASSPPRKKGGKGKRESLPVNKDEEKIKKLKSFVVACGVRKQWKREFQNFPTKKQQIQHLTKILEGLGMTGRMSMAKAKEIKARRDLEAEVSELAAARETESSDDADDDEGDEDQEANEDGEKNSKVNKRKKSRAANVSSGDESSDGANKPRKKKNPFAFLGDQGSEDSS
ncbi:hypothetical protein PCANC_13992 [Puccinia coronata f. sp. avenae]|uniref:DEK C-terminal domain-containing protein n=1 Tax=Puccinia coronata f. sp. avenae TaxID=200324 RepID=A0A2N5SKE4_9BASI|nr:hypothetical protein PCASD_21324 [Puccinia coronata f. sp. avenae]PLW36994.1 hypothetical protein PCANC_13992 [Puccinia coronata f. sp. avenae]